MTDPTEHENLSKQLEAEWDNQEALTQDELKQLQGQRNDSSKPANNHETN